MFMYSFGPLKVIYGKPKDSRVPGLDAVCRSIILHQPAGLARPLRIARLLEESHRTPSCYTLSVYQSISAVYVCQMLGVTAGCGRNLTIYQSPTSNGFPMGLWYGPSGSSKGSEVLALDLEMVCHCAVRIANSGPDASRPGSTNQAKAKRTRAPMLLLRYGS